MFSFMNIHITICVFYSVKFKSAVNIFLIFSLFQFFFFLFRDEILARGNICQNNVNNTER